MIIKICAPILEQVRIKKLRMAQDPPATAIKATTTCLMDIMLTFPQNTWFPRSTVTVSFPFLVHAQFP